MTPSFSDSIPALPPAPKTLSLIDMADMKGADLEAPTDDHGQFKHGHSALASHGGKVVVLPRSAAAQRAVLWPAFAGVTAAGRGAVSDSLRVASPPAG